MIVSTQESLDLLTAISKSIEEKTFHHHYHVLYDIAKTFSSDYALQYLEIGCYAGGSACLMLQRENTSVTSIDLGHPIPKKTVMENVAKLNKHNNLYQYIEGNSQVKSTYDNLDSTYDIIFIDGDHSYDGVLKDFEIYSKYLKQGGYIVFDDYNDWVHSPEVKSAVNFLCDKHSSEFEIIGTLKNTLNARGFDSNFLDGNCFIIKQK